MSTIEPTNESTVSQPTMSIEEILAEHQKIWQEKDRKELVKLRKNCEHWLAQPAVQADLDQSAELEVIMTDTISRLEDFTDRTYWQNPSIWLNRHLLGKPWLRKLSPFIYGGIVLIGAIYLISRMLSTGTEAAKDLGIVSSPSADTLAEAAPAPPPKPQITIVKAYFDPAVFNDSLITILAQLPGIRPVKEEAKADLHLSLGFDPADVLIDPNDEGKATLRHPNHLAIMLDGQAICDTDIPLMKALSSYRQRDAVLSGIKARAGKCIANKDNHSKIIKAIRSCLKNK